MIINAMKVKYETKPRDILFLLFLVSSVRFPTWSWEPASELKITQHNPQHRMWWKWRWFGEVKVDSEYATKVIAYKTKWKGWLGRIWTCSWSSTSTGWPDHPHYFSRQLIIVISSVRSSYSHPDLLVIQHHPLFQITPVLNTGLSLSEPLQLYKGYNAI